MEKGAGLLMGSFDVAAGPSILVKGEGECLENGMQSAIQMHSASSIAMTCWVVVSFRAG